MYSQPQNTAACRVRESIVSRNIESIEQQLDIQLSVATRHIL